VQNPFVGLLGGAQPAPWCWHLKC